MKIFLTGATGFVGGALSRALLARGDKVTALVRQPPPESGSWEIRWVRGDLTADGSWLTALAGHDAVIHAAGRLGAFGISEKAYVQLHVEGTRRLLEAAGSAGVRRLLYVSSPGVLGPTRGSALTEEAPYRPTNRYERSKALAEKLVRKFAEHGLPVVIVRPEFLYGPGDLHVLGLFRAIQRGRFFLINGGRSSCHPTYIDDGVRGMLLALEKGGEGEIYQIAGESPVAMRDFSAEIAAALGREPSWMSLPRPIMVAGAAVLEQIGRVAGWTPPLTRSAVDFFSTSYRFSWQKARQELGYEPAITLEEGIRRTVAWYRQNGYLSGSG